MKKIGIIGGLGPESTIDYYKEIIIYSVNMSEFLSLMKDKKYDQVTTFLLEKIEGLKRAGAEFAVLSGTNGQNDHLRPE